MDLLPCLAFVLELDKLKSVTRKVKPLGLERYENPAEHSWQIAMMAQALAPFAATPVDVPRVVELLLVHDIAEIDTGDVIAFATEGLAERKIAERAAAGRICGLLPEPHRSRVLARWEEFEDERTPEALFAHAMDRAMPVLLNLANNGQSWRENGISYDRLVARIRSQIETGCPALWRHLALRLREERDRGWFGMSV